MNKFRFLKDKYLMIFTFSLIALTNNYGQDFIFDKGDFLTGGGIGFSYEKNDEFSMIDNSVMGQTSILNFDIDPTISYFLKKKLVIGLSYNLFYAKRNLINRDPNSYFSPFKTNVEKIGSINPFIKYYVYKYLFVKFGIYMGNSTYKMDFTYSDDRFVKKKIDGIGIGIGYSIRLSECIFLDPELKYSRLTYRENHPKYIYFFGSDNKISNQFMFRVGLKYLIKGKKHAL